MKRSSFRVLSNLLIIASASAALTAFAKGPGGEANDHGPCAPDLAKYCADVKVGGGAREKCLEDHDAQLAPACKAKVESIQQRQQQVKDACTGDAEKLCKGVEHGKGQVAKCLAEHKQELSPACRADVEQAQGKREEVKGQMDQKKAEAQAACKDDIAKNCSTVNAGQGHIVKCLHDHESTLSPACKQALP